MLITIRKKSIFCNMFEGTVVEYYGLQYVLLADVEKQVKDIVWRSDKCVHLVTGHSHVINKEMVSLNKYLNYILL